MNAAAIEAACKAYSDTAINPDSNGLEEDITAAITAAFSFLRAEWETELRTLVEQWPADPETLRAAIESELIRREHADFLDRVDGFVELFGAYRTALRHQWEANAQGGQR